MKCTRQRTPSALLSAKATANVSGLLCLHVTDFAGVFGGAFWFIILKRAEVSRRLLRAANISWNTAESVYDHAHPSVNGTWRPKGSAVKGSHMLTAEMVITSCRLSYVLACEDDELPPVDEFLALLPPADEVVRLMVMTNGECALSAFVGDCTASNRSSHGLT